MEDRTRTIVGDPSHNLMTDEGCGPFKRDFRKDPVRTLPPGRRSLGCAPCIDQTVDGRNDVAVARHGQPFRFSPTFLQHSPSTPSRRLATSPKR